MDNYSYYYNPEIVFQRKQKDISTIRKHGILSGGATLFFLLSSIALAIILKVFNLTDRFVADEVFSECFDIVFSTFAIFVPFFIVMLKARRYHPDHTFALEKPKNKQLALLSIPLGLMFCLIGDRVATYISVFFKLIGIELTSNSTSIPASGMAQILYFISVVIVAPIVEEFAMRAVVLQPLRKYGDKFAIVMTATVFALMHQNMVQGIFAFIAGIVFGYICVLTGSVWCSIAIHCLNNLLSVVSMYLSSGTARGSSEVFYNFIIYAIIVLGIISVIRIIKDKNRPRLRNGETPYITVGEKVRAFLFAPTMTIAIIIMAINCLL